MPETIVPNSTVWLLGSVPLDNTYNHTLFFLTENQQRETFLRPAGSAGGTWILKTLTHQMYKRYERNRLRVNSPIAQLYDCNYMVFANSGYNPVKYFYAFVTDLKYVSNEVTEIEYQIDVMQTWFFDYDLAECYVEREHTVTDNWQEHVVDENIPVGEYRLEEIPEPTVKSYYEDPTNGRDVKLFSDLGFFVAAGDMPNSLSITLPDDPNNIATTYPFVTPQQQLYGGTLNGLYTQQFIQRSNETINETVKRVSKYIQAMNGAGVTDSIVNIFQAPISFWQRPNDWWSLFEGNTFIWDSPATFTLNLGSIFNGFPDGYRPKNMKCYTHPYCFYYFVSSDGESATYKYNMFNTPAFVNQFEVTGVISSDCNIRLAPKNYRGSVGAAFPDALYCENAPITPWTTDTFKCWLAQHKVSLSLGMTAGLAALAIAAPSLPTFAAIAGGTETLSAGSLLTIGDEAVMNPATLVPLVGVGKSLSNLHSAMMQPNGTHGNAGGQIYVATKSYGIKMYNCYADKKYMQIIDDYFTKYGYAVKRLKTPTRDNRPHFTYIKTIGCELKNNMLPAKAAKEICDIYDSGITFWKKWDEVGEYNLDNSPVAT